MPKPSALLRLDEARRWLLLRSLAPLIPGLAAAAVFLLALSSFVHLVLPAPLWLGTGGILFLAAAGWSLWRWRRIEVVARALDQATSSHDRFVSWLAFGGAAGSFVPFQNDVEQFARNLQAPPSIKPAFPTRPLLLLAASLLLWSVVEYYPTHSSKKADPKDTASAEALLEKAVAATEKSALAPQEIEKLKDILKEAQRSVAASAEPQRDALRALENVENSLNAADSGAMTQEEREALSQAAGANSGLAQALLDGPSSEAAAALSHLSDEALQKILAAANQHRELKRLQDLARQSPDQARRQLVAAYSAAPSTARSRLSEQMQGERLKSLGDQPPAPGPGAADDQPNGKEKGQSGDADDLPPGGAPGKDLEHGKGKDLTDGATPQRAQGNDESLPSAQKGEGPSLVQTSLIQGSDHAQANQSATGDSRAAEAAALDAVERENIPLGSRLLVRRYFEELRKQELVPPAAN